MVEAIIANRKTQTRRVVKITPQQSSIDIEFLDNTLPRFQFKRGNKQWHIECPYGKLGDILWVRETWASLGNKEVGIEYGFKAGASDDTLEAVKFYGLKWKPSIHMPKDACRIFLRIKSIRVERLKAITQEDSVAEGIEPIGDGWKSYETIQDGRHKGKPHPHASVPNASPHTSFMELWASINGRESIEANPWLWVIEFERITKQEAGIV